MIKSVYKQFGAPEATKPMRAGLVAIAVITIISAGGADAKNTSAQKDAELYEFNHVSCTGAANEVRVVITDVKKSVGLISADLFPNKEDGFLRGRGRLKQIKVAAKAPMTKFCITTPKTGDFAMAVYHDRNANGDFDKTGLGLPAEPWGISNNPKVMFRPPSVTEAIFPVDNDGAQIAIRLN